MKDDEPSHSPKNKILEYGNRKDFFDFRFLRF